MAYKYKYCNAENKINNKENFYVVQFIPILWGHVQRKKCISTGKKYKHQLSYTKKDSIFYNYRNVFVDAAKNSVNSF